jgi:hypothetical protein
MPSRVLLRLPRTTLPICCQLCIGCQSITFSGWLVIWFVASPLALSSCRNPWLMVCLYFNPTRFSYSVFATTPTTPPYIVPMTFLFLVFPFCATNSNNLTFHLSFTDIRLHLSVFHFHSKNRNITSSIRSLFKLCRCSDLLPFCYFKRYLYWYVQIFHLILRHCCAPCIYYAYPLS